MAEVALTLIAKSALQLFTSLAKDEFYLLWKSGKELERLENSIETISLILQDADKLQSQELAVQSCLSRLRKAMYDAEDFFDGLAAKALHKKTITGNAFKKEVRLFFSKSTNQLGMIFKIAHEVKSLRESLDGIKEDMNLCGIIRKSPSVPIQQVIRFDRDGTHSFVHEEDVIGRDVDRDRIIKMLLVQDQGETSDDDRKFSVVAIIGFGGLGKTTIAQYVYNNDEVKQGFDVCLWACINDLSPLDKVLIEIIASQEKRHNDLGIEMLQKKLRAIIGGRKFLVVLDDVWDENYGNWQGLEGILKCGLNGSKVLVTTRSARVAECLNAPKSNRIDLEVLSDESAWSLFVRKAFRKGELSEHPELEQVGRKIVRRCGNVPLAVILVGSLLLHKEKEERIWSGFLDNQLKELSSNDGMINIKKVLMVSYNDLPPPLKLCFAYCSLFPKDHIFDVDKLVHLWLSQGFVKPSSNNEESFEEAGETCFFYLAERCFFQEVIRDKRLPHTRYGINEPMLTAKMHDLLHDLAIDVAKAGDMFFRHIFIESPTSDPKTVRTFLFPRQMQPSSLDIHLPDFKMLRTLHLESLRIDYISDSIGGLIHLRYLDLSDNPWLRKLPESICKLHHLMILVLRFCCHLQELPPKIAKLVNLRQLYIDYCDTLSSLPSGLMSLTSLVNLDRLIVHRHSGGLRYLSGLDSLCGSVVIQLPKEGWLDAVEDAKQANIVRKHKLNGVNIIWKKSNSATSCPVQNMEKVEAKEVLEALEPHTNLERLKIQGYGGEMLSGWFCMLKNVKELRLYGCDHVEYLENEFKGNVCFPLLEILCFGRMVNLKGWWRQELPEDIERPCLPKVSYVYIRDCPELKGQMPSFEGIQHLVLEGVDVKLVTDLLITKPNCSSSSSFTPLDKLKELQLKSIKGVIRLPEGWIRHLTALQILDVQSSRDLTVCHHGLAHLTALRRLRLESCILEIGNEDDGKMEIEVGMPWKTLQRLEDLTIPVGDKHFLEGLQHLKFLTGLGIRKWEKEEDVELASKALQNLRKLHIGFDDDKTCDLRKVGIQNLPFLTQLSVQGCKELHLSWKTLLISMNLFNLEFYSVESVIDVEDMVVEQRSRLHCLRIHDTREWVRYIPWKCLSSLDWLSFENIGGMQHLPDGIQHLTSLEYLSITECENVRSLPIWFPQLTSLTMLSIVDCSEELKRRCEKEKGEDWPLIRHVSFGIFIKSRAR